jgi:hypothetical protein
MHRNPFHARFQKQLEQCLSSHDSDSDDTFGEQRQPRPHGHCRNLSESQLLAQQNRGLEKNFRKNKSKAPAEHTQSIFAHLASVQKSLLTGDNCRKRTYDSTRNGLMPEDDDKENQHYLTSNSSENQSMAEESCNNKQSEWDNRKLPATNRTNLHSIENSINSSSDMRNQQSYNQFANAKSMRIQKAKARKRSKI